MKYQLKRIAAFLRLLIVVTPARDITPDRQGMWGLQGLISNLNSYVSTRSDVVTAGSDSTLTAAQALAGALILAAGASGGFTITLPSTAALITAMGPTIPVDGTYSKVIQIKNNNVGQTGTVTAGDGSTTLTGTMTIATNTTRSLLLTVTSATTITIENLGSMSL